MKKVKILLCLFLSFVIAFGGSGCMYSINSYQNVTDYLSDKYNDTFYIDEKISPGIDVMYYEYHCHSSKYPNKQFVVYYENDFKDNYYGILIEQYYKKELENIVSKYFNDYKVYFRFICNYFDDDVIDVDKIDEYLIENPEQFFIDVFVYTSDEKAVNVDIDSLNFELKDKFKNYYISLNTTDKDILNTLEEDTYLSVEKQNFYTNTVK